MVAKSAWALKCERIHSTAPKPKNATVASLRGSTRPTFLPTSGDRMIANMPTGAVARPAQVAV